MQIWHMEAFSCGDRRLPHHVFPPKKLSPDQLTALTGCVYYKVDLEDTVATKKRLTRVKTERNVTGQDMFTVSQHIPDLNDKLNDYYERTCKGEDVVSMITDGQCYYDVEIDEEEDEWLRIHCDKGDLLVIPKGRVHRFTVTPHNYVQLTRFYSKKPDSVQG